MRPRTRRNRRAPSTISRSASKGARVSFVTSKLPSLMSPRSGPDQLNGPARALTRCLLGGWMAIGQLDGLATTIRFRLSSHACEGA
jgi:hypothetical protein